MLKGRTDAFITKLDANGQLVYSTYLGGNDFDGGAVIKVDDTGAAYVGGSTNSFDFPTVNPIQGAYGLRGDAFITKLESYRIADRLFNLSWTELTPREWRI